MPDSDDVRLLARRSELGYVTRHHLAMIHEPPAVPAEYQAQLTAQAQRVQQDQLLGEWIKCRDRISGAVEHFANVTKPGHQVRSDLRVLERQVARLDQRLAG